MKHFESRLLVEGVRSIEGDSLNLDAGINLSNEKSFEALLFERAERQDKRLAISDLFLHFKKLLSNLYLLLALLVLIAGSFAVSNVLFSDPVTSINFFWAFALFFIPNIFMFLVWLFFFFKPQLLENSSLSRLTLTLIKQFETRFNKHLNEDKNYQQLFLCYFNIHFGRTLGRYQLSTLTHLLWFCYFCGATLLSIIMLATHQVDFIWQTSILSSESFQTLTQLLAYLPQKLGVTVPSIEQIQQSYIATDNLIDAENRRLAWSSLLISSLFLYGLLPRLCLFLLMRYKLQAKKRGYQLDLSQAYYVQLRQILKPNKTSLGIVDTDEEAQITKQHSKAVNQALSNGSLLDNSYPVAIELSELQYRMANKHLRSYNPLLSDKLVNACDHQTQQSVLTALKACENEAVILYVSINRLPDRGLKRFIGTLTSMAGHEFQLCMIVENKKNRQRENDWYQLADSVGIKLDNILHIEVEGANNE